MKKIMAAVAVLGLVAPSTMAAVRPTVASNMVAPAAPMAAGARVGAVSSARKSNVAGGTALGLGLLGAAAVGVGVAAAAGAFDNDSNHNSISPQ